MKALAKVNRLVSSEEGHSHSSNGVGKFIQQLSFYREKGRAKGVIASNISVGSETWHLALEC